MPRVYLTKGNQRRAEAITALFTKAEKERVIAYAMQHGIPASVFIHQIVLAQIESAA